MGSIRFNDLVFDAEMLTARRDDGTELRLTRQERALLLQFTKRPGKLMTRAGLSELLTRDGDGPGERNIDFLVNRLRKRLGDNAREPRFIATQYGEGYVWIAKPQKPQALDAFLLIGPVYGLPGQPAQEHEILNTIADRLDKALGQRRRAAYAPEWRPDRAAPTNARFALDCSFYDDGSALHAAFVLRHHRSQYIVRTIRAVFGASGREAEIDRVVSETKAAIWRHLTKPPAGAETSSTEVPMEVRLHEAALTLAQPQDKWRESEAQLIRARAERPGDPELALMWGIHLYLGLIRTPAEGASLTPQQRSETEETIEAIALDNLAAVQHNPLLVLACAKLLLFANRGHRELVRKLADDAFATSTAFAAAFTIQAEIRMYCGEFAEALNFFDRGIELSEPGSEFHGYLLILKCIALMASGDRAALDRTREQVYSVRPGMRQRVGLLLAAPPPERLPPDLEFVLANMSEDAAVQALDYLFNIAAKHFVKQRHRRNIMAGLMEHLVRRFGPEIVPARIAESIGARAIALG